MKEKGRILLAMVIAGGCETSGLDWGAHLGHFAEASDGTPCVTASLGTLQEGDSLWIVAGLPGSQIVQGAVAGSRNGCEGFGSDLEEALPVILAEWTSEAPMIGVGVWGVQAEFVVSDGVAEADVDRDGVPELFGSCTSTEGVHLTVWTGPVGSGLRRWHKYHPLFYDVEPSCTEAETAAPYN